MANLILTAKGSDVTGADGSDEGMFLIVNVADESGAPVKGLKKTNFKIWELGDIVVVSSIKIFFFSEIMVDVPTVDLPGVYIIKLDLDKGAQKGSFVFGIAVTRRGGRPGTEPDRGQTLVTVVKLK